MNRITTYPFNIMGNGWEKTTPNFDDKLIEFLEKIQWWNLDAEKIFNNLEILCSNDLQKIKDLRV